MMTTTDPNGAADKRTQRRRSLEFTAGVLGGPILWALQFAISYPVIPAACSSGSKLGLYVIAVVTGVLTLIAGGLAWRQWRLIDRNRLLDYDDPAVPGAFLGSLGVGMSLLFALGIFATGIVLIFQDPCPFLTMRLP